MKRIPFWKKAMSYIIEWELESTESEYNQHLSLCISDGRIQLNAPRAIYSWEDKYDNFLKAFRFIFKENHEYSFLGRGPKEKKTSVLILGFGLGSIAQMLEQNFKKQWEYTGVEIDETVVYWAEDYILYKLQSPIQLIQARAEVFMETTTEQFDMICIDVFVGERIPKTFYTKHFLERVKRSLHHGGIVLFNHLSNKSDEIARIQEYFQHTFSAIFPHSKILNVDGNYILIGKLQ